MRALFLRVCCALIFFQALARSRFIGLRRGCARPATAGCARSYVCDVRWGTAGIEPTTSRSRSAYPATRPSPKHIMAACDAGAHALPRFCGRCPRALVTSLMVALRHSPSNRALIRLLCVLCGVLLCSEASLPGRGSGMLLEIGEGIVVAVASRVMGMPSMSSQGMLDSVMR